MSVAIDASMIVALLNPADVWHDQAHALQIALRKNNLELVYFDCVLAEAISVASRRLREKGRSAEVADLLVRLDKLVSSDRITWILPEVPQLYSDVLKQIVESSGELNFNDVLIALACQERHIDFIASFDSDFDSIKWLKRIASAQDIPAS